MPTRLVPTVGTVGGASGSGNPVEDGEVGDDGVFAGLTTLLASDVIEDLEAPLGCWQNVWRRFNNSVFPLPLQPRMRHMPTHASFLLLDIDRVEAIYLTWGAVLRKIFF